MQEGRGFTGFILHDPESDELACIVGRFILNFSVIEAASIFWWRREAKDADELGRMIKTPFVARVDGILDNLHCSTLSPFQREQAVRAWSAAKEFAKVRNNLAHNPITHVWTDREAEGPADSISLMILRTAHGENLEKVDSWNLSKLGPINDQLVKLAQEFTPLLESLPKPLGSR